MTVAGKFITLAGLFCLTLAGAHAEPQSEKLQQIVAGEHRSADNKARDVYRHPVETLTWLGLRDDMTVVEIFPGGGWYTEILAPFLRDKGKYYAAGFNAESHSRFMRESVQQFKDKLAGSPALYDKVVITVLDPPGKTEIAPKGSADMVLTFRNVHNWMAAGTDEAVFRAMYDALKPGGVLGVVEHRGDPNKPQDPKAQTGYVTEQYVIDLAKKVGFNFADRSDINANPKDTRDHPKGVWTLPPTLRMGDTDKEKFLAIGESDRMTLKFIKP